jgi:hypothetical protein
MRPELIGLTIVSIAVLVVGLLMLADRAGWQSPLPRLQLSRQWVVLVYALMVALVALQVLWLVGVL